jgi:catechol 2,3-dioxygenase-like lactoylglutathione lyase family enzyme
MAGPKVDGVRSVELGVPDPRSSAAFYTDVWGLSQVLERGGSIYLRGTGAYHHVVALHRRATPALLRFDFTAADRKTVDALHQMVKAAGGTNIEAPAAIDEPGGGYGFTFKDPEGRVLRVLSDDTRHKDATVKPDLPVKITHAVLNTRDRAAMADFYARALGFRVIDRTKFMTFLCCSPEHHSIAFAQGDAPTLNHLAFLMKDMREAGYGIEWGVGRHGPGNNVFSYFVGADGVVVEYTSEVQQVDETYKVKGPDEWVWPPGRIDHWGIAVGPTDKLKAAQKQLTFAPEIFHPAA